MSNKIKCYSCHSVFDESELELIQVDGGTYITACPKCKSDNWQYKEESAKDEEAQNPPVFKGKRNK